MTVREATLNDKQEILQLLDEFRADCIEQITGEPTESDSARTGGSDVFESLLAREDYFI